MKSYYQLLLALLLVLSYSIIAKADQKDDEQKREWNRPIEPFQIIDNIYYVGATEVASYLITTPQGHIILDSGFEETVPQIRDNVQKLGFKFSDVKILINSHAHFDHAGGLALLKELTGAKLYASEADAVQLEIGDKNDFQWGDKVAFKPVKVDHRLRDQEVIELGGIKLTARITPGHTKGCTSWTLRVKEHGRDYDVVIIGSTTAPGYKLINNSQYPNIFADYQQSFRTLKSLPCDIFLAPHGSFFGLTRKITRLKNSVGYNPFIDPVGYRDFLEESEQDLIKAHQQQAATQ